MLISHKGIEPTPYSVWYFSKDAQKGIALSITPVLTGLFSMSIESGIFPVPSVLPIPKGGDCSKPSNYRPISLLSVDSRMLAITYSHSTCPLITPLLTPNGGSRNMYSDCITSTQPGG